MKSLQNPEDANIPLKTMALAYPKKLTSANKCQGYHGGWVISKSLLADITACQIVVLLTRINLTLWWKIVTQHTLSQILVT